MDFKKFTSIFSLNKSKENLNDGRRRSSVKSYRSNRSSIAGRSTVTSQSNQSNGSRSTIVSNERSCIEEYLKDNTSKPKKAVESKSDLEKRKTKINKEKDILKKGKTIKEKGIKLTNYNEKKFTLFLRRYKEITATDFLNGDFLEYYIKLYNHCNPTEKLTIITPITVDTIEKGALLKQYLDIITNINFKK